MEKIVLNIKLDDGAFIPEYGHETDACMDLRSNCELTLKPGERGLVTTGIHLDIPEGFEVQIRSRSGLALKKGVCVLNAPGIIDAGYTGDIGVILINLGNEDFVVNKGDKVAQMITLPIIKTEYNVVTEITKTKRGECCLGSTGV